MKPLPTTTNIQVGTHAEFLRVCERAGYGVFCKTQLNGKVTWLIARQPKKNSSTDAAPPASVCAEFQSESAAINALHLWSTAPVAPQMLRRPDEPGTRKNSHVGAG